MSPRERVIGTTRLTGLFIIVVVISTMVGSVAEELIVNRLFDIPNNPVVSVLFVGIIAGCLALLFVNWRYPSIGKLVRADAEILPLSELRNRKFLITGYSPWNTKTSDFPDPVVISKLSIEEACDPKNFALLRSWQQNIRAITTLRDKANLKTVYLINPETNQFREFHKTITALFGDTLEIKLVSDADDLSQPYVRQTGRKKSNPGYEDFSHVQASIERALRLISEAEDTRRGEFEDNVAIDITSGTKTFSMAAAIATLNTDMIAVYTTTFSSDPWTLIPYNASIILGENAL